MKKFLTLSLLFLSSLSFGQNTIEWSFTGATSGAAAVTPTNATISAMTIGNSNGTVTTPIGSTSPSSYAGASATNNIGNACRIGALNTAAGGSAYMEFTLTPAADYSVEAITDFSMGTRSTSTGAQAYDIRTSLDGYATAVATGTIANTSTWALKTNTGMSISANPNVPVTIRIYLYGGTGSPSASTINTRLDDIKFTGVVLPVELLKFTAKPVENDVTLSWTTASERDNSHFVVQHSTNGHDFADLGQVKGVGNSTQFINYSFLHDGAPNGLNYYRLKQVDLDGKSANSAVRSVMVGKDLARVYPTIAQQNLTIESNADDNQTFEIFNIQGQKVVEGELLNRKNIDISTLHSGVYFVKIGTQSVRFIKQ